MSSTTFRGSGGNGRKAIVIGAGIGGLAVAIRLARLGYRVSVLEQNQSPGGKMQEFRLNGFRFDTGPSLLTLPDHLFDLIGVDRLDLSSPAPLCRYHYPDGVRFDCYQDLRRTNEELQSILSNENERGAYKRVLEHAGRLYNKTADVFLENPLYDRADLRHLPLGDLAKIDALTTVSDRIDKMVDSPYLRQFFKRFTTYNGSSPFQAPGTLNVIPHVELTLGGYYVKGGLYGIVKALEREALDCGAVIEYGCRVEEILIKKKRASGVRLADGSTRTGHLVLSNSDATDTLLHLIDPRHLSRIRRWRQKRIEPSSSGFVLLLACNRTWKTLDHHNIFFSDHYRREFEQIFRERTPPADPTVYVTNTSISDPSDAPPGCSNLFVLVNVPWLDGRTKWEEIKETYGDQIIKKLESSGLQGLAESVRYRQLITPLDFERLYGSNRGSIYGTSSNGRLSAFLRPRNKMRGIEGLYLVGGSTHPGGGIPLVLLSAKHAAELVERYEKI